MTTKKEARWCYYVPEAQDPSEHGGYVPSHVVENEAGHSPMLGNGPCAAPWVWGKTYAEAARVCDEINAKRGISREDMFKIVASSMRAS